MLYSEMIDIPFDFKPLLIYISGLASGVVLALLIYILFVLLTLNKKKKIIESIENNISEDDVREMIKNAQENYILLNKSNDNTIKESAFKEVCLNLVNDIAKKCFPKSKNPLLELSIDESLLLAKYVIQRLEDVLNVKGFRIIRRISIAQIYKLWNVKKKVDSSSLVKEVKKYSKLAKIGITITNTLTKPFKLIGAGTKKLIISKIILLTISIIGEEAYKIYTKQAIKAMDPEFIQLNEEIEKEILEESIKVE